MLSADTIVALSSVMLPSGIAIVRVSGPKCSHILQSFVDEPVKSGNVGLRNIYDPKSRELIDQALVLVFQAPQSFSGEDIVEFHTHGSIAVVSKLISCLTNLPDVRLAKAGEFTQRAFENGKLDLSHVEAISDLVMAETESQRVMALARLQGNLSKVVMVWRDKLVGLLATLEAHMDFADEDDITNFDVASFLSSLSKFSTDLNRQLKNFEAGRIIREGFRVGIGGLPNVGKSSIFNALAGSDLAIVTSEAGTTRDIKELRLDIDGQLFTIIDSAGIRSSDSIAETEGVTRALEMYETCDLVFWISAPDIEDSSIIPDMRVPVVHIANKSDLAAESNSDLSISVLSADLDILSVLLSSKASEQTHTRGSILISHERDKLCLLECKRAVDDAHKILDVNRIDISFELVAEDIRLAIYSLERLIGTVSTEEILGKLFSNFCIGK